MGEGGVLAGKDFEAKAVNLDPSLTAADSHFEQESEMRKAIFYCEDGFSGCTYTLGWRWGLCSFEGPTAGGIQTGNIVMAVRRGWKVLLQIPAGRGN